MQLLSDWIRLNFPAGFTCLLSNRTL